MRPARLVRFAAVGASFGLVLVSALTATNTVSVSRAERDITSITPDQKKPMPDCNGVTVTAIVTGGANGGNAEELVFGLTTADANLRGQNGNDCILGGGGDERHAARRQRHRRLHRRPRYGHVPLHLRDPDPVGTSIGRVARSDLIIDLGAIRRNVRPLTGLAGAQLWAVVKADGYGHGALDVGGVALRAGASALCVATVPEGLALRRELGQARILVMGPASSREIAEARDAGLELVIATARFRRACAST